MLAVDGGSGGDGGGAGERQLGSRLLVVVGGFEESLCFFGREFLRIPGWEAWAV